MDTVFDQLEGMLAVPVNQWLVGSLGVGALSLLVSFVLHRRLLRMDPGTEAMRKIAAAIRTGAMAFLRTQYTILAVFAAVMFMVIAVFLNQDGHGLTTAVCFLAGCGCSALS